MGDPERPRIEVLLVEDNDDDLDLALRAFKKRGLTQAVEAARDGSEAIDFLFGTGRHAGRNLEELPRVIFLDIKLPRMSGLDVLKAVRADPRTHDIPVVVLSSSSLAKDVQDSYALGANSYIVKPVDFDQFSATIGDAGVYWLTHNAMPRI
jgi:CheY-like chemotaxis protein